MKKENTKEYQKYVAYAEKKMEKWKTAIEKFEPSPQKEVISEYSSSSE
jgi:hypothetical protein